MTPREAAEVLGCDVDHVRWLIRHRKLKAKPQIVRDASGRVVFRQYSIHPNAVKQYANKPQTRGWPRGRKRKGKK